MSLLFALPLIIGVQAEDCSGFRDRFAKPGKWGAAKPIEKSGPGLWIGGISFSAADIAEAVHQRDALTEAWQVEVTFAPSGRAKFRKAQHCRLDRVIEISFDRKLISRPILREQILGDTVAISGNFDEAETARLAAAIVRGAYLE